METKEAREILQENFEEAKERFQEISNVNYGFLVLDSDIEELE